MQPNLYNLAPSYYLLLLASLVALIPLYWVWRRTKNESAVERIQLLTWVTLFLTFDLVMFGAFTRLTDSGLGCPDWPGCYGSVTPIGASASIQEAQIQMPTGPVTFTKAWIEMVHRYFAMTVGSLILILAALSWYYRERMDRKLSVFWPSLTLVWVCVQGAFGALTVTLKLLPLIVTLHLIGGITLLGLLTYQACVLEKESSFERELKLNSTQYLILLLGILILVIQIALGGWVSTNYAVLACNTFPLCQGTWWPAMNFQEGFSLWRELGMTSDGGLLSFEALTAVHYVHRLFSYVIFLYLGFVAYSFRRIWHLRKAIQILIGLLILQLMTGLSNVLLDWPLLSAVLHTGGAAALFCTLIWMLASVKIQAKKLSLE